MKKILLTVMLIGGAMFAKAQSATVIVGEPINQAMTADKVVQTADGFELSGDITVRAATPKELETGTDGEAGGPSATIYCGLFHNWVCGVATVATDPRFPGLTWIKCEGSSGKCAKVSSK